MRTALLIVVLATVAAAAQNQPPAGERPGRISGRVVRTPDGAPLGKVTVALTSELRGALLNVRTGPDGAFDFGDVPAGEYRVEAARSGYVQERDGEASGEAVTVKGGRVSGPVVIRMQPAGVISGRVSDEDGEAAEGLAVTAFRLRFSPGGKYRTTMAGSTVTDDLGAYRIPRLVPGIYYVQVTNRSGLSLGGAESRFAYAPVYFPGVASRDAATRVFVTGGAESRGVDVAVRPGSTFTIRGVVSDAAGAGDKRYTIGFASGGTLLMQFVDARDGSFALTGIEPGDYTLVASSMQGSQERYGYQPVSVVDADLNVVVEVGRAAEIGGEVRTLDGGAMPDGLTVRLLPETDIGKNFSGRIRDGKFTVPDVPDGNYLFELSGQAGPLYVKEVRCGSDDVTHQPLRVAASRGREECRVALATDVASVTGTVMRGTTPAPSAVVVLLPAELERRRLPRHTATVKTNASGQFTLEGVVPGDYLAFALPPSDDEVFYDLEFAERHRARAVRLSVGPAAAHTLGLTLTADLR